LSENISSSKEYFQEMSNYCFIAPILPGGIELM